MIFWKSHYSAQQSGREGPEYPREPRSPECPRQNAVMSELSHPGFPHSLLFELLQKADLTDTGFSAILIREAVIWQGCQ